MAKKAQALHFHFITKRLMCFLQFTVLYLMLTDWVK